MKKYIISSIIFTAIFVIITFGSIMPLTASIGYSIVWGIGVGCLAVVLVDGFTTAIKNYRELQKDDRKEKEMREKINEYQPEKDLGI